ncbi:MAG: hypothetical protein ACOYB7_12520 [Mycobacterium sp.]
MSAPTSTPKVKKDMTHRKTSALVLAGLLAVTGMAMPAADARPNCHSSDFQTVCQTNGSVSIKSRPGTVAPPANMPHIPWLGQPGRRR